MLLVLSFEVLFLGGVADRSVRGREGRGLYVFARAMHLLTRPRACFARARVFARQYANNYPLTVLTPPPAPSLLAGTVSVRAVHRTSPRSLGDALRQSQVDQLSTSIGEEKWAKGVPLVMSLL